jgi:transposase
VQNRASTIASGGPGSGASVSPCSKSGDGALFARLDVHDGTVAGWVTDSSRGDNFVDFLADLVTQTPAGLDLHYIVDNLSARTTAQVAELLDAHRHVHLHFTPTHASWLKQVELFFSILERAACCASASSTPSTTSPTESSPSSRATTDGPLRSAGPTTAAPSKPRKS